MLARFTTGHRRRDLAVVISAIALLAASCSSSTSRTVQIPADGPPTTRSPDLGRTITDPTSQAEPTDTTVAVAQPDGATQGNVIHVLGSVRSTPIESEAWEADIPIVQDDLATIASVNCNLADDCDLDAIADWAAGRVDVLNLATSANVLSVDELLSFQGLLEERGVAVVGFGEVLQSAERPFIFVSGDLTVSVHALSMVAVPEVQAGEATAGIAGPPSFSAVLDAVATSRDAEQGTVVIVDWGGLEDRAPNPEQTLVVEQLIDAGANAVVGHGPDFLQRFDQIGEGVAAYALGNTVSASEDPLRRDTAVLRLEFARPGRSCLLPATATAQGPTLDDQDGLACAG